MGFVKTLQEIVANYRETGEFYDAEILTVYFETKPEIVQRLLPPPLKPAELPVGFAFVANYPRTNFGVSYLESALFLQARFGDELGNYCLAMPVTDDMALILGREVFGYPKKIGQIHFKRSGQDVTGWTERHGTRFLEMKAKLTGTFNVKEVQDLVTAVLRSGANAVVFNFKYFPAPEGRGFDYNPRLIREEIVIRPSTIVMGEAELVLKSSEYDPWADVEVVRVLGATYTVGNNTMLPGKIVAEVDQTEFTPYAFMKVDFL